MKRLAITLVVVGVLAIPAVVATARQAHSAAVTRHCGNFKFGTDGFQPGPGGILAKHVSCWFARATALLGAAPGWSCHITIGITFVCKPRHGNGVVTFFGE